MTKIFNWDYSQASDHRWQAFDVTERGACQALSIFWVIKTANGDDYIKWLSPPKVASSKGSANAGAGQNIENVRKVMVNQSHIFHLRNGGRQLNMKYATDMIRRQDDGSGNTNLVPVGKLALLKGASARQIAAEITQERGYVFLGWYKDKLGGHACGAHVDKNGQVLFFDPNFGEYWFDRKEVFQTWFENNLFARGYSEFEKGVDEAEIQHFKEPPPKGRGARPVPPPPPRRAA